MKELIELESAQKEKLIKTISALIDKLNREMPIMEKSITLSPNENLANEFSLQFVSAPFLIRVAIFDLCVLFKLYLETSKKHEQNVMIRIVCGQLYEFTEDVPQILGKKYRKILENIPAEDSLTSDLNFVIKDFNVSKRKHQEFLKIIRHNVSHHRDIDAVLQFHIINKIDFNYGITAFIDFVKWFTCYSEFEQKIIKIATEYQKKN